MATREQVQQQLRDKKAAFDRRIEQMQAAHLAAMESYANSVLREMHTIAKDAGFRTDAQVLWITAGGGRKVAPGISGMSVLGAGGKINVRK